MSEPEKKKRVLYNVQDLFFGLVSGEQNLPFVHEDYEFLKRLHRVQSVSYDFNISRQDIGVLGLSSYDDNVVTQPPDIGITITHGLEGLNNEKKMGFNVLTSGISNANNKEFTNSFLDGNRQQNIYLAVNQTQEDIRETIRDPSEIPGLISSGRYGELGHPNTTGMGMVVFQNCYMTNYAVDISLGNFPKADTTFVADNAIYLNSASGQNVPILDGQTATSYNRKNSSGKDVILMVPRYYARVNPHFDPNYTFKPSDAQITIETRPVDEDTMLEENFEGSADVEVYGTGPLPTLSSSESYGGLGSLKVVHGSNEAPGGVRFTFDTESPLIKNKYYTVEAAIKTTVATIKKFFVSAGDSNNSAASQSNLSAFTEIRDADGWTLVKLRVKLDKVPTHLFIYTKDTSQGSIAGVTFYIDNVKVYRDSENPPLRFHSDLLQSFQLTVPLSRDNIACVGHKYYLDRAMVLPVKTTFSISMSSQDGEFPVSSALGEDAKGDFLDNLRKDEVYDVYVTFYDDDENLGMRYRIFGARFDGVNYGADIDNNKTSNINFSMSNDYDYGRNVISADGRGLFVVDFLVDDNLNILTDDYGVPIGETFPHSF